MNELNPLSKKDDLSTLKTQALDWDAIIDGKDYNIISIPERPHSEGGSEYGLNDYYAYPSDQLVSINNLTPYQGSRGGVSWGFVFKYNNHFRHGNGNHKDDEIQKRSSCYITRNGENFYEVYGRSHEYTLAKAQVCLVEFLEGLMDVISRNWDKKLINNIIWHKDRKGIIIDIEEGCLVVRLDDSVHDSVILVEFLDPYIRWHNNN